MADIKGIAAPLANVGGLAPSGAVERATKTAESGDVAKAKEAARQFESLLVHQMLSSMSENVPKDELLNGGLQDDFARDMYNQALAESISKGRGIGIRNVLERELVKNVKGL